MSIALGNAATGMEAMQGLTNVVTGNIANMKTTAFKEKVALFSTLMSVDKTRVGSLTATTGERVPVGVQIGLGVQMQAVSPILTPGTPVQTDNPYHIMIQGPGFFQVTLPSGDIAYTRAGTFELNETGIIVTHEGNTVSPGITVPVDAQWVKVNAAGEVFVKIPGNPTPQSIGQLELATFANPAGLEAIDNNMFLETASSGTPITGTPATDGFGKLLQHWYEGSNVNSVKAITDLIEAQRAFEMNSKSAKTADEMEKQLNSLA